LNEVICDKAPPIVVEVTNYASDLGIIRTNLDGNNYNDLIQEVKELKIDNDALIHDNDELKNEIEGLKHMILFDKELVRSLYPPLFYYCTSTGSFSATGTAGL
jgi:hypothetical protein